MRLRHGYKVLQKKTFLSSFTGFNTNFHEAVEAAASIVAQSRFSGIPILFSWPSEGNRFHYTGDEEQVRLSKEALIELVRLIKSTESLNKVHLLSHSMGGRLAVSVLQLIENASSSPAERIFDNIVFAAPDVARHEFILFIPTLSNVSVRGTLYASEKDRALSCSKNLHVGNARAGQTGPNLVVNSRIDTIDFSNATGPASIFQACNANYSYIISNSDVLNDFQQLIELELSPIQRDRLYPIPSQGAAQYWVYR